MAKKSNKRLSPLVKPHITVCYSKIIPSSPVNLSSPLLPAMYFITGKGFSARSDGLGG